MSACVVCLFVCCRPWLWVKIFHFIWWMNHDCVYSSVYLVDEHLYLACECCGTVHWCLRVVSVCLSVSLSTVVEKVKDFSFYAVLSWELWQEP